MLEFICGLFFFCTSPKVEEIPPTVHTSAYIRSVKPNIRVNITNHLQETKSIPWKGHFSAKNFQSNEDQKKLKLIKSTLRKAVSSLPRDHTQYLDDLEVYNKTHISRGMANSHKMLINTGSIESDEELAAIFVHEMGHIVDLGVLKGHSSSGVSAFFDGNAPIYNDDKSLDFYRISWVSATKKKKKALPSDFVSGYSQSDPFEDFAEHYIFYRLHGNKFREMMKNSDKLKQKYIFLKYNVFRGKEFQKGKPKEPFIQHDIWDATLLNYDLRKDLLLGN